MNEQKDNNGVLFHNLRKTSDNSPTYRGHAMINGENVRITAWSKVSANGTEYISLAFEREADFQVRIKRQTQTSTPLPACIQPVGHSQVTQEAAPRAQQPASTPEGLEDLPF